MLMLLTMNTCLVDIMMMMVRNRYLSFDRFLDLFVELGLRLSTRTIIGPLHNRYRIICLGAIVASLCSLFERFCIIEFLLSVDTYRAV